MSNNKTIKKTETKMVDIILFILFCMAITLPLMFRGLYFEKELLPSLIGIFILFIIWGTSKSREKDFRLLSTPIDYLFLGVVLMYLLSITYGVNKREAVFEFSRYLVYFIIFIMTKQFSRKDKYGKYIARVILFGGLLVSTIGIGSAIGTWEYTGAIIGNRLRLSSTFQYPNTMAAYVAALYFIAITALINEENKFIKSIYGSLLGIFVFSLILTLSRAMFLIFPLVIIIYFIILPNERKMESVLYIVSSIIISGPGAFLFSRGLNQPTTKLWFICLIVTIGTGTIIGLLSLIDKKFRGLSIKKLVISLSCLGIILLISGIFLINSTTSIVMENITNENKTTTVIRNISSILPNSSYNLEIEYIGENNSEAPYVGRVRIYSINSKGGLNLISSEDLVGTGKNDKNIKFTTEEDSIGIKIYFQNVYMNTKVEYLNANIFDLETSSIVKKVPLKYKYLGESFVNRLQNINVGESSFIARMLFNIDGLKIIKEKPVLGAGGGGWLAMYRKHQSYPYSTTLAHNYVLQLWIEIGTVGFTFFLTLLIFIGINFSKTYKKCQDINNKTMLIGLGTTIITMLIHAAVDFDMSLPSYAIVFWVIMGLLVNKFNVDEDKISKFTKILNRVNTKVYVYSLILLSSILILNHVAIIYSERYKIDGAQAFEDQDLDLTIENFEKVVKYDKLDGTYKMDLASLYVAKYRETENLDYVRKAVDLVDSYLKLAPYDSFAYGNAASFNFSIGEIDKGIEQLEKSVQLKPLWADVYIQKIDGYKAVVNYFLSQGETEKAKEYLKKVIKVKEDIKLINDKAYKPMKINNDLVKVIGEIQYLYENIDIIEYMVSNDLNVDFAYYFDLDINNDGNLDMLVTYKPEGSQIEHEALVEGDDSYIRIRNEGEVYGFKYVTPISLKPNATYVIEIKARGTTKPETFNLYAWSNGAAEPKQGELTAIELDNNWRTYSFEFTTDSDIEPGRQHIRIRHNGNDMGYIDVKDLVIYSKYGGHTHE